MQNIKTGIGQKIFAHLERVFRPTPSHALGLENTPVSTHPCSPLTNSNHDYSLPLAPKLFSLDLADLTAFKEHILSCSPADFLSSTKETPVLQQIPNTHLLPSIQSFQTTALRIDTQPHLNTTAKHVFCQLTTHALKTSKLEIPTLPNQKPSHPWPLLQLNMNTHQNNTLITNFPIKRTPIHSPWIPKPELRICWRKAVLKTKLTPEKLKLVGFFSGLPLACISRMEFEHHPVLLKFWINPTATKHISTTSICLFLDKAKNSFFLMSSQDE